MKKVTKSKIVNTIPADLKIALALPSRDSVQIRVIFHGLVVSAFRTNDAGTAYNSFDVGAFSPPVTGSARQKHIPKLIIYNTTLERKELEIEVKDKEAVTLQSLQAMTPLARLALNDTNASYHRRFDQILDYERLYYPAPSLNRLKKMRSKISPRFTLQNGVLHTLIRTPNIIKTGGGGLQIAQVIAADMAFTGNSLPTNGTPIAVISITNKLSYMLLAGQTYNIIFENDCGDNCDTASGRLDLNYLNDTFTPPEGQDYYVFNLPMGTQIEQHLEHEIKRCVDDRGEHVLSGSIFETRTRELLGRLSPCGLGYFGYSDGLDHNP